MKKNNIPQFTMPSPITGQTQIEFLELRIRELEDHIMTLNEKSTMSWDHDNSNVTRSFGFEDDTVLELEKILHHWMKIQAGNISKIMQFIEEAPIDIREKMLMVFMFAMTIKPPQPQPTGPSRKDVEAMIKMIMDGGR